MKRKTTRGGETNSAIPQGKRGTPCIVFRHGRCSESSRTLRGRNEDHRAFRIRDNVFGRKCAKRFPAAKFGTILVFGVSETGGGQGAGGDGNRDVEGRVEQGAQGALGRGEGLDGRAERIRSGKRFQRRLRKPFRDERNHRSFSELRGYSTEKGFHRGLPRRRY